MAKGGSAAPTCPPPTLQHALEEARSNLDTPRHNAVRTCKHLGIDCVASVTCKLAHLGAQALLDIRTPAGVEEKRAF